MSEQDQTARRSAPQPKPWIAGIHAYTPGKANALDGRPLTKLSANENPLGTSPAALQMASEAPPPNFYPDPKSALLRETLGKLHDIDPALIVCGTGSDELLNLAAQAYAGPGDEVVYVRYGFSVYDIAARRCGAQPVVAPDKNYGTDVDALLDCVGAKTKVVFVANPNNPTGTFLGADEIARLHAGLPDDVLLVLDQAYAEYLAPGDDDSGMALAHSAENVLVTRTFSKIYGLAGERVGWATGASHIIAALNRIRGPFNVNSRGQMMAAAALGDQEFVAQSREHNAAVRTRFMDALAPLSNHGIRCVPSYANFVLVTFAGALSAEGAYNLLVDKGYATRQLGGQGLGHALRITIGTEAQMDEIAEIISKHAGGLG